jgi:hypothetical protein
MECARSKLEAAGALGLSPVHPLLGGRLNSGLTQTQFAALLGVSKRTLEQSEQGRGPNQAGPPRRSSA